MCVMLIIIGYWMMVCGGYECVCMDVFIYVYVCVLIYIYIYIYIDNNWILDDGVWRL